MWVQQSRLFWAINLSVDIKRKLASLQDSLRTAPANVKWVEQNNLHLTVKFLGDVDDTRVTEITRGVNEVVAGMGSFELELSRLGFFPGPRRPRVIWVGVHGDIHKFRQLHRRVEECMAALGWALDNQSFAPHLTLGRLRTPQGSEFLVRRADEIGRNWGVISGITISGIDLMKSQLNRNGPIYRVLASVKLNA